ncbi:hypothetical protein ACWC10_35495 [Streptomyces sp. NPDC001595]|uniref:hypothetical protein n=1 Tax=Streptomyces sp. NPDC001532 TaxID=3154520 RepID=UPI00332EDA3B
MNISPTTVTRVPAERERGSGWAAAVRSPWTVLCAVATVVLGPAAATASALDRANAAPPHEQPPVRADQARAHLPSSGGTGGATDRGRQRVTL